MTGGAGYLARALYARAEREGWDVQFTAFSRDDSKHVPLMRRFPSVKCIRGDVAADRDVLAAAMQGHDYVIHMAAVKYVDLAESNVFDTVRVNVDGSRNVIMAAISARVTRAVGISTDKACEPVSVYGMTKAVMERMLIEGDRMASRTEFAVCRYGNVVGSTGSVIPLFRDQLARNGEITLTAPGMTRFWMGVDEAVDCILATFVAPRGATIIPIPRSMSLLDMVHAAVGDDVPIRVTGLRPGEKVHEQLIGLAESVRARSLRIASNDEVEQNGFPRPQEGDAPVVAVPGRYYELRGPGEIQHNNPFIVSSSDELRMEPAEMARLAEESKYV